METVVRLAHEIDSEAVWLREAVERLRAGDVVAFPTETVYGLGANALDAAAVGKIFEAKGRPSTNPLIVHVGSVDEARKLARDWPETAERLASLFWPGPLSLVLPKTEAVPDIVTAGGSTVAIRMPNHPVALALLRAVKLPLAAPSANRSNATSPTQAEHVARSLAGRIGLILDGGPCQGGLESTVVDLSTPEPRVLRLGLVSREQLSEALGVSVQGPQAVHKPHAQAEPARSPGQLSRHYAPNAPLQVASAESVTRASQAGERVGWLLRQCEMPTESPENCVLRPLPNDPAGYAAELYAALHELDQLRVDRIVVSAPPEGESWDAIRDRLRRASTPSTG